MSKHIKKKPFHFFFLILLFLFLFPSVCRAATYYVATNGNDGNNGTNTSSPLRTITAGISRLAGGDTLYIRAGTYTEALHGIPSGTAADHPTTISGYGGETVTINGIYSGYVGYFYNVQNIILENLIIDGTSATNNTISLDWYTSNITLRNMTIQNAAWTAIFSRGDNHKFQNLDINRYGVDDANRRGHGFYIKGHNNLVEDCKIHHGSGHGVHVYATTPDPKPLNTIIRRNIFYANGHDSYYGRERVSGIGVYVGDNTLVYNNIVYDNGRGIAVNYSSTNAKIYNNTVFGNQFTGIYMGPANNDANAATYEKTPASDTIVRNNIIYQNGTALSDAGIRTVSDHNLTTNPSFVNIVSSPYDFHLQPGSPAIDTGIADGAPSTDFDGHGRPYGAGFDIGAFEYGSSGGGTPTPTPPSCPFASSGDFNCDGKINESDLNTLLSSWLTNGKDITGDGIVNESDLNKLLGNWRTQ